MRPDAFALVMATGIVSVAAADHDYRWISNALAVVACVALAVLAVTAVVKRLDFGDVRDPSVVLRLFTFVAACAVVGSRLEFWPAALWAMGTIALLGWLVLVPLTVRSMRIRGWARLRTESRGGWLLASVGTSGLATVAADLHVVPVALVLWTVAIAVYLLMTWLILARAFDERLDPHGFEPDSWILMGGLAIATLAGDHIHHAGRDLGWSAGALSAIEVVTVLTWLVATLWLVPLVVFLVLRLSRVARSLRFAGLWWAMVFPLGMYAAATHTMRVETGWQAMQTVSLVFFWIALAAWLSVGVAGLRR
ncbi:tellurite resistance/C4-dicarboxylate transporter family protein [Mycobacterium sp. 21AC1]|uniref:tellurite resistance/C4-dicarboxylate transporter family protein n=1 Tax=[Mycobacterium] appelbergii TaxID=2939269 RepID=UPI00293945F6|nr:tellurite resistance/C4-dicarboxylate transporter family protein [Mycobacterium sp. 21AC1]MDV3129375.1 tellurite resistance/C4-dicarboxylate transporter family protein [Mycobacterium sp. 21AC1]